MKQRIRQAVLLCLCFAGIMLALQIPVMAKAQAVYSEGDFHYQLVDESIIITEYFGTGGEVTVPAAIAGYPVSTIAKGAFVGTTVTTLHLPDTIMTIEEQAMDASVQVIYSEQQTPGQSATAEAETETETDAETEAETVSTQKTEAGTAGNEDKKADVAGADPASEDKSAGSANAGQSADAGGIDTAGTAADGTDTNPAVIDKEAADTSQTAADKEDTKQTDVSRSAVIKEADVDVAESIDTQQTVNSANEEQQLTATDKADSTALLGVVVLLALCSFAIFFIIWKKRNNQSTKTEAGGWKNEEKQE